MFSRPILHNMMYNIIICNSETFDAIRLKIIKTQEEDKRYSAAPPFYNASVLCL